MGCVGFCKNVTTDHAFTNLHTQTQRAAELPLYIIYHNHQLIHFKLHCMHCILDAKKAFRKNVYMQTCLDSSVHPRLLNGHLCQYFSGCEGY